MAVPGKPKIGGRAKTAGAKRIHGSIAHDLGVAIVTGHYQPGDTLSGEIEFAEQLQVSRSAYREAVRILAAKGLVESRPKTGTRVTARSRWQLLDPDVLAWAFEGEPSAHFIADLFELRMIVEPAAAELAARRRDGTDLARMGHALEEMAQYGLSNPLGRAADQLFHHSVLQATRNEPLISLSSSIEAAVGWTTIFKQRNRKLPRDPLPDHRMLFTAIADGDPAAARAAMTELVRLALQDTETALRD
ncbi:FadR/GntR family transcriptional regulator [Sphingomonas abietis]|uniref:FadR/GntR family transcriptional regulator n=1 Tax=Sphingomonas abietis TaxID=3012344 RepID=A0ABY7NRH0_9SPHN|nr:FadR/GntR family transcriptional regulator [Sphingomonas abietis]WBO23233.1 FadR/GntR family transcriptional regulator [Sphingomonas abietis]